MKFLLLELVVVIEVLLCVSVQSRKWFFSAGIARPNTGQPTSTTTTTTTTTTSSTTQTDRKQHRAERKAEKAMRKEQKRNRCTGYHIITDIDDTVVSSGGKKFGIQLGGIDDQYKHGQFYPGVVQFALELATAPLNILKEQPSHAMKTGMKPSKISVLTARAKELKFAMSLKPRGRLCATYQNHGNLKGMADWGIGEVHYGSVAEWVMHWRRGWRKFKNFERMLKRDIKAGRDTKYIFIGDTGDRDEDAAERMAQSFPGSLKAVFLHSVYETKPQRKQHKLSKFLPSNASMTNAAVPSSATAPTSSVIAGLHHQQQQQQRQDRTVNGVPIYYFRTYIGAAAKALHAGLIDQHAARRVAVQAVHDLQLQDQHEQQALRKGQLKQSKISSRFAPRHKQAVTGDVAGGESAGKLGNAERGASALQEGRGGAGSACSIRSAEKWADLRADAVLCRFLKGCVP